MIDFAHFERCILTLERAHFLLNETEKDKIEYDLYRSACIKEFEIILEQSGKLLKKCLKPYFHSSAVVDRMFFKDIFRQASNKGIIDVDLCERFLNYRDNRNLTAHDYGVNFAEETMEILPQFIADAKSLAHYLNLCQDATQG